MKVNLLSENLQKKISFVNKAVSIRSQLPILLNLLLEAREGKLLISSTDLEIGIQVEIPANVEEEGGITVPAKIFSEVLNSLPKEKITLQTKEGVLELKTSKTKSSFQTIPKEEFPKLYEEKGEKILSLKKEDLDKNFTKVVFAASSDTGRPALSGILIRKGEDQKGGFLLVATDGYRLSVKDFAMSAQKKDSEFDKPLLVPARAIREIINIKDSEGEVDIYASQKNNQIMFEQNGLMLVGRLIDAQFPVFEKIIPTGFTTRLTFDKEEMQQAVKMCAIFARETANIIKFVIKKEKMVVSANMPSVGENTVEVGIELEGEENEIAFNAKYVIDILANTEEEEMVFEMTGPLSSGVFKIKNDPSFLHLIMPIRVQG